MGKKIKAAIVGGSGHTGLELLKILRMHKCVEVKAVTSRTYKNLAISEVFPSFGDNNLVFSEELKTSQLKEIDVLFLCLPPLKSMEFLKECYSEFDGAVIDLGSDFRIESPENFKLWYKKDHELKSMLPDFVYGLSEIYRDKIKETKFVANPGCYPTSVILGLAPLLANPIFEIGNIIIDSKSGITGAGRKLKPEYLFCSVNENFSAYSVSEHRHIGEIEQEIKNISGKKISVSFTPHLLPVNRGIFTSIYCITDTEAKVCKNLKYRKPDKDGVLEEMCKIYQRFYQKEVFVKFLGKKLPQLKDVTGTNMCHIGLGWDERAGILKIFSVIDNLLKGAAGQAVQNMNIMMGIDEKEGLLKSGGIFS